MDEVAGRARLALVAAARGDVMLGPFGAAAAVTPELLAYQDLLADRGVLIGLRRELEELTRTGAGARRIYAALLLRGIDDHAGRAALEAMCGSDEPCALYPGGCSSVSAWLGETASYLLGSPTTDPRRRVAAPPAPARPGKPGNQPGWLVRALERLLSRL